MEERIHGWHGMGIPWVHRNRSVTIGCKDGLLLGAGTPNEL
jgi:hypothetical protein